MSGNIGMIHLKMQNYVSICYFLWSDMGLNLNLQVAYFVRAVQKDFLKSSHGSHNFYEIEKLYMKKTGYRFLNW